MCSRRERGAVAPATSVPPCPRRASGAPAAVAVLAHRVPRLRRGRVPASAPASGVRVVDVPASRAPRPHTPSRARAERAVAGRARGPSAVCSCRACRDGPWPPCPRRVCGVLASMEPRSRPACRACRPSAVCSRTACRRRVLASNEPTCSSSECGRPRARADGAVCSCRTSRGPAPATRERPRLRRECRRPAAAVCSRRVCGVLVPMEPPPCARVERAAAPELSVRRCGARVERAVVLALRVPRPCASVEGAAAHEPRERPPAPSPRVPPCPRRGSGTLVPWAPCPNGGRAFAERAALIVSHR